MTNDWQSRPAIYPGEWLDDETVKAVHDVYEIMGGRRQTVQSCDNASRKDLQARDIKHLQAIRTAEMAIADMRRKYWAKRGMSAEEIEWFDAPPVGREIL